MPKGVYERTPKGPECGHVNLDALGRCRTCRAAYMRSYYAARPGAKRAVNLKGAYGITLDDYEALLTAQGGVCAICRQPSVKNLHVDHDHATDAIRGLLCANCNTALGLLADDPARLLDAVAYLTSARGALG